MQPVEQLNQYPFTPYPRGWYRVAWSADIKPYRIYNLRVLGRELICFRDTKNEAHVLDAHCPHLGAHIGFGGYVDQDCVVCPYHEWRFDGQGKCRKIPYTNTKCPNVRLKTWPILDRNGCIYLYFHPQGKMPDFEVDHFPQIGSPEWTRFKKFSWKVRVHPFELVENGVDLSHFKSLHGFEEVLKLESLEINENEMVTLTSGHKKVLSKIITTNVLTRYIGPGMTFMYVYGTWDMVVTSNVTPIDEKLSEISLQLCVKKSAFPPWDWLKMIILRQALNSTFTPDFKIWENRIFAPRPPVMKEDGPISKVRRWCEQFAKFDDNLPDMADKWSNKLANEWPY